MLRPGEVLVAKQVIDYGPRGNIKIDPERLYSYPSDIYAWGKGTEVKSAVSPVYEELVEEPKIPRAKKRQLLNRQEANVGLNRLQERQHQVLQKLTLTQLEEALTCLHNDLQPTNKELQELNPEEWISLACLLQMLWKERANSLVH